MILLFCGLSGAGKSTLAAHVKNKLERSDIPVEIIDADEYRQKLFKDLGYTRKDRNENIRRLGFIANKFSSQNIISIISAINPYDEIRKELIGTYPNVKVVHVDCNINVLIKRDTKGLYKKALLPDNHPDKISNLTGINDPFEAPENPDLYLNTSQLNIKQSTDEVYTFVLRNIIKENYAINPFANVAV
ncbi:MAG: adenylyl-sulfate kinase [Bacteroidetes bacterium]|jgi:adenylylsulfate kinase|nr:adenylyl-sulfate kinase [Bacteroidota bacterium]